MLHSVGKAAARPPQSKSSCLHLAGLGRSMLRPYGLLRQKRFPPGPGFGAGFAVGFAGVGGFAGAHEAVAGAFVGYRLEGFACGFHVLNRFGKCRADSRVVSGVEAVDRSFKARHRVLVGWRPVENKRSGKVRAIGGEAERVPAAPTISSYQSFAV